jgi:hypothetical protein
MLPKWCPQLPTQAKLGLHGVENVEVNKIDLIGLIFNSDSDIRVVAADVPNSQPVFRIKYNRYYWLLTDGERFVSPRIWGVDGMIGPWNKADFCYWNDICSVPSKKS